MPVTVLRFNLVDPAPTPTALSARYRAAVEMAAFADDRGVSMIQTEEHHATGNGWMPSPLTFAGAVFGATRRIGVTVSALITPLHDPLRLAEDLACLDLLGNGRLVTVAGLGYRPEEYAAHGKDWHRRGALQDEVLETLLSAWTGEPFTYQGRTVRVTPQPYTQPHPLLLIGGSSRAAARRAARLGLPLFPSAHLPELEAYYHAKRAEFGTEGWVLLPPARTSLAASLGGSGPYLGGVRPPSAARGPDVRVLAVRRHPLRRPLRGRTTSRPCARRASTGSSPRTSAFGSLKRRAPRAR